ncbi:diguanylate cyclase [Xanthomonas sp. AmX2]|uniref:ligand-binding sensor domain-containing diguanylate cyclase n=1 Tax=Xanthomonas sp. TaxID=29446 RepID=UPI00197F4541|nr:ligand-binding sensor domain-containing diguanylate cyclase [Xanthomonas sp.]MBN6150070.1 diguanylate cyclase [Xanthomonas sp.]
MRANRRTWRLCGTLLWLWLWLGPGASDGVHAQSIPLRRYAHDQGLLGLAGTCLLQTRQGMLWVCTESGLYRFDGRDFQQVPLHGEGGHLIADAEEDAAQRLWVASSEHLYVDEGQGLRRLSVQETGPLQHGGLQLASPRWGTVVIDGERALHAQRQPDGRWRLQPLFDAATLARVPQLGRIVSAQAEGDALWLGCGRALCRIGADRSVLVFGQAQGLPEDVWRSVLHDRDGALWVRGQHQLMQLPAGAARFVPRPVDGAGVAMFSRQAQLLLDAKGRVLLRTNTGLARWEGGRWRLFDRRNGLPESAIVALLLDRQGDLWMTVDGEGVVRWSGYDWIENWDVSQGMRMAPTWAIQRDRHGALLLGNEGGGSRQSGAGARFRPWLDDAGIQLVGLQVAADGSLWSADSLGDLRHHDGDGGNGRLVARLGSAVKRLYLDRAGRLWFLSQKGVYLLPRPQEETRPHRVQALPMVEYTDIHESADGTLWIAGAAGAYRLRGAHWSPLQLRLDGKPARPAVDKLLVLGDGTVWASLSRPGLWRGRVDGDGLALRQVDDAPLKGLRVYLIRQDRARRIWVGHNQGLDVYDGRRWSRLSQSQGLLWDDTSESAYFEDRDGSVWIGNSKGVSHVLDPQRLFQGDTPAVTLSRFTRGDRAIGAGARLPWSEQPLHIEVTTPALYDDRHRATLRYRFAGQHSQWISTPNFEIEHPPLAPGDYVFEIQLLDSYRRSASPLTRVAFSVAPVWWRSAPMLGLYALAALGLAIALVRWRERQLRRQQRELAALVALRTRELEHDKRELEKARAALAVKASHDELTGLPNRAGVLDALIEQIGHSQADGRPLAVAMIDLDHFKRVNDEHGHLVGDAVLVMVGQRLTANLRGADLIGRYGGEELLGVLPGLPMPSHERLQELREAIGGKPLRLGSQTLTLTASIGVAWYRSGETVQQLLGRADDALYRAKHLGRNRIEMQLDAVPGAAPDAPVHGLAGG